MEQTVNQRVILLKEHLKLGRNEFAAKAKISPSTYDNLVNGGNLYPKTINSIADSLGASREWLLSGKGKMMSEAPVVATTSNPWKDALISELKEEVTYYRELLKMMAGGGQSAKLKAIGTARLKGNYYYFPNQSSGSVSAMI